MRDNWAKKRGAGIIKAIIRIVKEWSMKNSIFFLGISVGLLLSMFVHLVMPKGVSDIATIEREAKKLGMDYPSEFNVSFGKQELTEEETNK